MAAVQQNNDQSYWAYVKRQFRKKKTALYSLYVVYFFVAVALLAPFLANEKPLVCKYNGHLYFPVFKELAVGFGLGEFPRELQNADWKNLSYDFVIFPPVPYLPMNQDNDNIHSKGPFDEQVIPSTRWKHWFGTDELGRDVLSGMIHGTRIAMTVGIVSMSIASVIGIFMGALAGFFGDNNFQVSRIRIWMNLLFLFFGFFYGFGVRSYAITDALGESLGKGLVQLLLSIGIFAAVMVLANLLATVLKKIPALGKQVNVPFDLVIMRIIEVLNSIPTLFLILLIISIVRKPNLYVIMLIIGATSWTGVARFIRAELLKVRNLEYIEAAQSLGFSNFQILFKHAIPNALSPVLISIAFGIAGAILTESTLSFLGLGPADTVTWGQLLSYARQIPQAWWLAIFPGFAIFINVTVFNLIGDGLTDALDPRLKQ
ncbi:MAG: ABC transporter permease [Bacteroidetes bacterium]|nr:ABC transporter permease [Bacteroidota bacterium]MBK8659222.1 ABC transporter permease [Bacteroidota bacterium]